MTPEAPASPLSWLWGLWPFGRPAPEMDPGQFKAHRRPHDPYRGGQGPWESRRFDRLTDAARWTGPGGEVHDRCPMAGFLPRYRVLQSGLLVDLRAWDLGIWDSTQRTAEEMERLDELRAQGHGPYFPGRRDIIRPDGTLDSYAQRVLDAAVIRAVVEAPLDEPTLPGEDGPSPYEQAKAAAVAAAQRVSDFAK